MRSPNGKGKCHSFFFFCSRLKTTFNKAFVLLSLVWFGLCGSSYMLVTQEQALFVTYFCAHNNGNTTLCLMFNEINNRKQFFQFKKGVPSHAILWKSKKCLYVCNNIWNAVKANNFMVQKSSTWIKLYGVFTECNAHFLSQVE